MTFIQAAGAAAQTETEERREHSNRCCLVSQIFRRAEEYNARLECIQRVVVILDFCVCWRGRSH